MNSKSSTWPARTADTMSDAIALSSPSGRMSKRARRAAEKLFDKALFGDDSVSLKGERPVVDPAILEAGNLRRAAKDLRDLATRGMSKRKFTRAADRMERQASDIEASMKLAEVTL